MMGLLGGWDDSLLQGYGHNSGFPITSSPENICYRPQMIDPLSNVIELLQPRAIFSKGISGSGAWAVRYAPFGQPSFCAVLEGRCRLEVVGEEPIVLQEGDFVLLPATPGFTMSSLEAAQPVDIDPRASATSTEPLHHGTPGVAPDVRLLGGYFVFGSPDADLLVSLLPALVHVRGLERLALLVRLVREESLEGKSGCDLVLARLVEILLIEALRSSQREDSPPGLLRGLADPRLAIALRHIHGDLARPWTVATLAKEAAMSRSAFHDRFASAVGLAPMGYLLAWRMVVAKSLLRQPDTGVAEVAERVGYGSASTFSTAFSRHVGHSPGRWAREE